MSVCRLFCGVLLGSACAVAAAAGGPAGAHAFSFTDIDGEPMPLERFAGKAMLVVNTASRCGFTRQYSGLQELWSAYRDRGLVVIGVPSNDFGQQEPGSNAAIKDFCEVNWNIDFPLAEKSVVRGPQAHPFYAWARSELGDTNAPRWNFHKYLVAPDGRLVQAFASGIEPDSAELREAVERVLPAP